MEKAIYARWRMEDGKVRKMKEGSEMAKEKSGEIRPQSTLL